MVKVVCQKTATRIEKALRRLSTEKKKCFIANCKRIDTDEDRLLPSTKDSSMKTSSDHQEVPTMSTEEKKRLKKDLMEALRGDLITGPLRGFLRKYGLVCSSKDKIEAAFGSFGDNTLWTLKRVVKSSSLAKEKEDHVEKKQQDDGRSKSQQFEEKMDIKARITAARAAKEALNGTAEALQMRRKRERERLEEMERAAVIVDNLAVLNELEKLCQCSLSYLEFNNPLEKIGLHLKEEFYAY